MKNIQTKYKLNFKTMKKGLLTVLAASLVFVGCQNYDDQFDDLNAQISALKSQVDGLSSLSAQVASLSGTISGLQSGVAAAQAAAQSASVAASGIDLTSLSASLAELETKVNAVQTSLAGTATAASVATLQAEIDAIEADVDELLTTSNIYSTAVTVNSASTLDAALALGNKLNILNAAATITVSTAMDQSKVQTLVNRINTMTGNLTFNSSSTTETTFENLTSVSGLYVNQKGGYNFKNLTSAAAIQLNDQYKANISVIDFRSLATVTSIATTDSSDSDTAHTISFNQATELHLTALARYPGTSLTIVTKEGATLAMGVLDDKDLNGLYEQTSVTLTGPSSFTTTLLDDGALSFTNVATVNVTDYRGTISVNTGVETFTGTDIAFLTVDSGADDLTTITADMKRDDEATLTSTQTAALAYDASGGNNGDISLSGLANLTSATISGDAGDIVISSNPNLTTVTISANAFDLTMDDDDNLTSVTVTGAKFHDVSITNHADLATLTLDHTTKLPSTSSTASEKAAALTVTGNASLTSLTNSSDDIDALTVTGNAALATVNFTGLADDGSATSATAAVWNNNLAVSLVKDGYNTGTGYTQYTSTDTGSITTTSGIDTLKAWLDATVGVASGTTGIYVFVDQVDKYEVQSTLNGAYTDTAVPSAPSVTTEATANSNSTSIYAIVAKQAAETTTSGTNLSETMTKTFPATNNSIMEREETLTAQEGFFINVGGLSKTFQQGDSYSAAANGSTVATVTDLISYINADTSWANTDITITASSGGYLRSLQTVNYTDDLGAAQTVSAAGTLWYKLGTTTNSGATGNLTAGGGAANIAMQVAAKIEAHTHPVHGGSTYNAVANGAVIEVTQVVSVSGYADDVTTGASVPTISFVIDAAMTSTTAKLGEGDAEDINAYSGSTADAAVSNTAIQGSTNGFNLSITKKDVVGITFKLVNSSTAIARLAAQNEVMMAQGAATSNVLGGIGLAGSTSVTLAQPAVEVANTWNVHSAFLVSGTHFIGGPSASYAVVFSSISSATTSTDQSAAITDRTGWL